MKTAFSIVLITLFASSATLFAQIKPVPIPDGLLQYDGSNDPLSPVSGSAYATLNGGCSIDASGAFEGCFLLL